MVKLVKRKKIVDKIRVKDKTVTYNKLKVIFYFQYETNLSGQLKITR